MCGRVGVVFRTRRILEIQSYIIIVHLLQLVDGNTCMCHVKQAAILNFLRWKFLGDQCACNCPFEIVNTQR